MSIGAVHGVFVCVYHLPIGVGEQATLVFTEVIPQGSVGGRTLAIGAVVCLGR
jgi:hypothetical protein